MFRSLFVTLLIALCSFSFADETGWVVGLGVVSSDVNPDEDRPFFPSIRNETKQYMLIPNLSYQWQRWSLGADGVGWKNKNRFGGTTAVKAGFPSSSFSIGGQQGWFRYGLSSSLNYSDGLIANQAITAGPIDYSVSFGFNDRSDELSQKIGLGFPLWINKEAGLTVIGSAFIQQDNRAFTLSDIDTKIDLAEDNYWHTGLGAFAIFKANEQTTLLFSGTLQFNDENLVKQVELVESASFNIFTLLSYRFGK